MKITSEYWSYRYSSHEMQWDVGYATTPLVTYFKGLKDKTMRILIPGCGNSYEAEYLHRAGFEQVFVTDWSRLPLEALKRRVPDFPEDHIIFGDFFELEGPYDLIVEQTFFCSLPPSQRVSYTCKMKELLAENGTLIGVLFDDKLNTKHPPYGGSKEHYLPLFDQHLVIHKMERCYNSIPARANRELFIKCSAKHSTSVPGAD